MRVIKLYVQIVIEGYHNFEIFLSNNPIVLPKVRRPSIRWTEVWGGRVSGADTKSNFKGPGDVGPIICRRFSGLGDAGCAFEAVLARSHKKMWNRSEAPLRNCSDGNMVDKYQ